MLQEPQLNCFEILLAEKLLDLKIEYKNFFWRAGIQYYKSENSKQNVVVTQNHYYDYYLLKYFGVKYIEIVNPKIENILKKPGSYIIKIDYFYLNYCHMYRKNHHVHALIIDVKKNFIIIQDNYFGYMEKVELELLRSWWNDSKKHLDCKLIRLEKIENCKSMEISTIDAIVDNLKMMVDGEVYEKYPEYKSFCGLSAIENISSDIQSSIIQLDFSRIDFLLEEIDKICRSRKQAADFFNFREKQELKKLYMKSYTKWSNIFLTLMKAVISEKVNLFDIRNMLFEVKLLETDIVNNLKNEVELEGIYVQ